MMNNCISSLTSTLTLLAIATALLGSIQSSLAFAYTPSIGKTNSRAAWGCTTNTALSSSEPYDGGEEPELILGDNVQKAIEGMGSESGYLAAAKKRNEEARRKALEEAAREEEERAPREPSSANYGPGDLSSFQGFANDGFEASAGNDSLGGWDLGNQGSQGEEGEEEEEPSLFLFGDEDADSETGLIL